MWIKRRLSIDRLRLVNADGCIPAQKPKVRTRWPERLLKFVECFKRHRTLIGIPVAAEHKRLRVLHVLHKVLWRFDLSERLYRGGIKGRVDFDLGFRARLLIVYGEVFEGLQNRTIASTTAQVSIEMIFDLFLDQTFTILPQSEHVHRKTGRAVATL